MTAPAVVNCPECSGQQMPGHPAGALMFRHIDPCSIRDAEDATQAADAERALLAAWPIPVPPVLWCTVNYWTGGKAIRHRVFSPTK